MAEKSALSKGAEKFLMSIDARTQLPKKSKEVAMTLRSTIQSSPITLVVRKRTFVCLARLGRLVNSWVAAAISCHAHRAALLALSEFDERALNDVGLHAVRLMTSANGGSAAATPARQVPAQTESDN